MSDSHYYGILTVLWVIAGQCAAIAENYVLAFAFAGVGFVNWFLMMVSK